MIKRILSVIAAIVVAALAFFVCENLTHKVYPPPTGLDTQNIEAVNTIMKNASTGFFALLLLGYAVGSFLAGIVLRKLLPEYNRIQPTIVGLVLTLTGALNFFSFYHPIWVIAVGIVLFLPCVFLGYVLMVKD
jgi:hypothetical protein